MLLLTSEGSLELVVFSGVIRTQQIKMLAQGGGKKTPVISIKQTPDSTQQMTCIWTYF